MKLRYVIILSICVLVIGFVVGQLIPVAYLQPVIINKEINLNDFYTRIISLIGAAATLFATAVALFKEDIKKLYEYASLNIGFKDSYVITEILDSEAVDSSSTPSLSASKFEIQLYVQNTGRLAARGCQIYLEHLSFKSQNSPTAKDIITSGSPLPWIGKAELSTIIPSLAKTYAVIIEILSPALEVVDSEGASRGHSKPQIKIAGLDLVIGNLDGLYTCVFMVYSENSSPVEFKIEMKWNGKWQHRLTEMRECISVTSKVEKK